MNETQKIMDPACGTGGFIVEALRHIWKKMDKKFFAKKWEKTEIEREKIVVARKNIFGCDKDNFLNEACKAYMCILGDGSTNVLNDDSLAKFTTWEKKYDIILTNPPFGQKIMVEDEKILENFTFWRLNSKNKRSRAEPQILFLELCCNLLTKNGRLAIVLPEASIFGNKTYYELRKKILQHYKIKAVFSLPPETFKPFTGVKPAVLILENSQASDNDKIICVNIQNIGHDKRGKILYKYDNNGVPQKDENGNFLVNDELDDITSKLKNSQKVIHYQNSTEKNSVFFITHQDIKQTEDLILIPSYYNGFLNRQKTADNQLILTFKEIIKYGIIEVNKNKNIPTGNEIGSINYLKDGAIPFIRTSDITNLEIRSNPHHFTSEEIYQKYKNKQDIKPYDILLVKDGKHLVGEFAFIMPGEEKIIFAAGFYKIRVVKNEYGIDTWNFAYALNSENFKKQIDNLLFYSTIPHLSNRVKELRLSFPKDKKKLLENSEIMKKILTQKFELRKKLKKIYTKEN